MSQKRNKPVNRQIKRTKSIAFWFICSLPVICLIGIGTLIFFWLNRPISDSNQNVVNHSSTSEVNETTETFPVLVAESGEKMQENQIGEQLFLDDSDLKANGSQVYYEVFYFNTGDCSSSNNSERTTSASVIKVFIMEYVYSKVAGNELSLEATINGTRVADLVTAMIQHSDNETTNTLIDYFGMADLNAFFLQQGYQETRLERRMLDEDARSQGLENYTSLADTMAFLKSIFEKKEMYPYSEMLEILKGQAVQTKIPALLPEGVVVANKTGELGSVENDIGIVFAENSPFAIAILTNGVNNPQEMRAAIGRFTLSAFEIAEKQAIENRTD